MFLVDHNHIINVIESCTDGEHTTSCHGWIKDMYNKSMITLAELGEYAEIIYEKDMVLLSKCDFICFCEEDAVDF